MILLIEDDTVQATALQEALRQADVKDKVLVMEDAESAVHYLSALPPYQDRILPGLILLDLSLPVMGGLEFLYWLRSHGDVHVSLLPVIVREESEELIAAAYDGGANSVFPRSQGELLEAQMRIMSEFWRVCESPL